MRRRLINQQSEPRFRETAKTLRLSVKARIMMALFALMLIPQGTWAQDGFYDYGLTVNGTSVNNTNNYDVFYDGKVSYNPDDNRLTLNGYDFGGIGTGDILYGGIDDLEIDITGTNIIGSIQKTSGGTGALKITSTPGGSTANTLTIGSTNTPSVQPAINGFASVTLDGIYIISNAPYYYDQSTKRYVSTSYSGGVSGDMTSMTFTTDPYYPLWIGGTQVTLANQSAIHMNEASITGGTLVFDGTSMLTFNSVTASNTPIISGLPSLTIHFSGTNKFSATSYNNAIFTTDDNTNAALVMKIGGVGATFIVSSANSSIQGFTTLSCSSGTYLLSSAEPMYYGKDADNVYRLINPNDDTRMFPDVTFTSDITYPLWIDDKQVTAANGGDVFGNSTSAFTATELGNTLSLNGLSVSDGNIVSGLDNLTIDLHSDNTVTLTSSDNAVIKSFNASAPLKFKTSGTASKSLQLNNPTTGSSSVISGFASVDYMTAGLSLTNTNQDVMAYNETQGALVDGNNTPVHEASLSPTIYNLTIAGTPVTSANASNVFNDGKVSYVHDATNNTGTLTLNGAQLSGAISTSMPNLTIRFVGTNKINTDALSGLPTVAGDNAISSDNTSATLTIEKSGDGSLELYGKDTYSAVAGFTSISYGEGCYLHADQPTKYSSDDKRFINFANGDAPVRVVTISTDVCYPLWIGTSTTNATQVTTTTITAGVSKGTVTFTPATADTSSKLSLSGATLNAKILSALGDLVIDVSGSNTITSPDSGSVIRSANAGTLTIKKAEEASSNAVLNLKIDPSRYESSIPVIQGFSSLLYPDFSLVTSPSGAASYGNYTVGTVGSSKDVLGLYYTSSNSAVYDAQFTSVVNYGLSIAGRSVTSANADNVFSGDNTYNGKVKFTPDLTTANSGTLTLTGFVKTSSDAAIVSSLDNLTIEFSGTNELGNGNQTDGYVQSTNATAKLTFKGGTAGGTLELKANGVAAVNGFASVSYDGAYWTYSEPITYTTSKQYESRYGALTSLTITTTRQYPLWLDVTQVSENNKDDIFNDLLNGQTNPSASYNATDNILTLDNCSFGSYDGLMCGLSSLTISLKGDNSISAASHSGYSPLYSSVSGATLDIEKAAGENNCSLVLSTYAVNDNTDDTPVVNGFSTVNTDLDLVVTIGTGTTLTNNTIHGAVLFSETFSGGNGSSETPFLISKKEHLVALSKYINLGAYTAHVFKLTDNIDWENQPDFDPIGNTTHPFRSTFLGNNNTISNLTVSSTDDAGLFGVIQNGSVYDLTLSDCTISGGTYAGAIVGKFDGATISRTKVTGSTTVTATTPGAIVGQLSSGNVTHSTYEYTVTTQVAGASSPTSGYTPRAIGKTGDSGAGGDNATQGTVLYTKTLSTPEIPNGTIGPWYSNSDTYPNSGEFAPGQTAYFLVHPTDGYAITSATVTYTIAGDSQEIPATLYNSGDGDYIYSFAMPDADDVTATVSLAIDVSSSSAYTASIDNATYSPTGSLTPTKVTLTPMNGSSAITLDSDKNEFTIKAKTLGGTAADFTNAGTYVVTIQGNGNYTGTTDVNYTIDPKSATGLDVNVGGSYTYTGSAIVPADADIVVKDGSKTLTLNTDYTITSYSNNTDAALSTAASAPTVTISGKGNYDSGTTRNGTFTIGKADLAGVTIDPIADQAYTSSALTPSVSVKFNGKAVDTSEYTANYTSNTNVGTATVTLTSTGKNFTTVNNKEATFKIVQATATITASNKTVTYNGTAQAISGVSVDKGTAVITYYNSDEERTAGTGGFTTAPTNAKTYYVLVTQGDNNYTSTPANVTFTINPKSATGLTVTVGGSYTYTGSAIEPAAANIVVKDGSKTLELGTDYTITSYSNNTDAALSTAASAPTVMITGKGNYDSGTTKNGTFTIGKADLAGVTIDPIADQTYTSSALTPSVSVKFNGKAVATSEYTANYTSNTDVGTATVTLTSTGKNFTTVNNKEATFKIVQATATITASNKTVTYNGTAQAISGVSVDKGTAIITYYNSDDERTAGTGGFTTAPTNAKTYYVLVTQGDNNYTSTPANVTFTINPKSATGLTVTVGGSYTYTGSAIEPAATDIFVSDGGTPLVEGTDYTISYNNNTDAGATAEVIITGKGNYDPATNKTEYFTIGQADFAGVTVDPIADQTFTGSALTPPVSVTFNGTAVATSEYTPTYTSNTDVGTATVTLTSTGTNFTTVNTKVATFEIVQTTGIITATDQTVIYNGMPQAIPGISIDKGTAVITYYNSDDERTAGTGGFTTAPTNAKTYYVLVTQGDNNYTSTPANVTFTINPKSATGLTVTVGGSYTYTGSAIEPASTDISVSDSGTPLVEGTDYTISYNNNTDAGTTAEVIITGKGNYDSATNKTEYFTIDQATITSVDLDQTLFTYDPGVTHYVAVTAYAGTIPVPPGSIAVTVDGVATNGASTIGTHTVRATAVTGIANNFKGYAENTFEIQERTINISFGERTFRTFYDAGEPFLIPNNMTAYIVTGVSSNTVTLKKVSFVQAGIPVLLESTPGTTNVADPAETFTGNLLKYATATVTTDGSQYVLYSDEFVKATGTITGNVYLDLTGLPSPARAFTICTENTTAIETIDNSELTDDNWYDMQGRKINKPTKTGIYIKDGKKVVVKTRY